MHLLLKNVKWDSDGMDPVADCNLPLNIIVLDAPSNVQEYLDEVLGEEVSEVYGFCHYGFEVETISPDVRGKRTNWNIPDLAIMQAPDTL